MAAIAVLEVVEAGVANAAGTAASVGGDTVKVQPTGTTTLRVRNTGSSITVTISADRDCNQGFTHSIGPITIPATTGDIDIPIPQRCRGAGGNAAITYSGVTGVTVNAKHVEA